MIDPDDALLGWCRPLVTQLAQGTLDRAGAIAWLGTVRYASDRVVTLDSAHREIAEAAVHAAPPISRASAYLAIDVALAETPYIGLEAVERALGQPADPLGRVPSRRRTFHHQPADAPYTVQVIADLGLAGSSGLSFLREAARPWPRPVPLFTQAVGAMREALDRVLPTGEKLNQSGPHAQLTGHHARGELQLADGFLDDARASFEAALALREALAAAVPGDAKLRRDVVAVRHRLADVAVQRGELAAARGHRGRAIALLRDLVADEPRIRGWQIDAAAGYARLGELDARLGELDDARGWFEHALTAIDALARALPLQSRWRRDEAVVFHQLGELALRDDQRRDARGWFEHAHRAAQALLAAEPLDPDPLLATCLAHVGLSDASPRDAAHHVAAARAIHDRLAQRRLYQGDAAFDDLGARLARA